MQVTEVETQTQYDHFEKNTYLWLGYRITLETASMCVAAAIGTITYNRITFPFAMLLSLIAGFSVRAFLEMPKKYFSDCLRNELAKLPTPISHRQIHQIERCKARIMAANNISHTIANGFLLTALVVSMILCGYEQ